MKNIIISVIAAFLGAVLSAMGLGGGGILLLYLTAVQGVAQLKAQGINLLFFIPIGGAALIMHTKNKLICWKIAAPAILCGIAGSCLGVLVSSKIGSQQLSKLFAVFLMFISAKELIASFKHKN